MQIPAILKISNEKYHSMEGISKSGWYLFEQSPLDYWWNLHHPKPSNKVMDTGTVAHSCVLEDEKLEDIAVKQPDDIKVRNTSKPNAKNPTKWEIFRDSHPNKIILTGKDWENVKGMIESVKKHPRYEELLTGGVPEQSFFWNNSEFGFLQKCRPDYLPGNGIITSLKTTATAHPWRFGKIAGDKRYHWSACLELAGVSICTGALHDKYYHFVVEQEQPHQTVVYEHYGSDIDAGQQQLEILYQKYAQCLKTDAWPGYPDGQLHLPAYSTYVDWDSVDDEFLDIEKIN